jgi:surface antigen
MWETDMKKHLTAVLLSAVVLSGVTACDGEQIGTIAGAAGGAVAGRAIGGDGTGGYVGLILGAVVGGYLGGQAGKWLDERDQKQMADTTTKALETGQAGQAVTWNNPDSGNRGSVTPQAKFKDSSGQVCRDFSSSASSAQGQSLNGAGTACKQADGTWRIVRG